MNANPTIHFYHVTNYFFLYPLLYGVALSDSVMGPKLVIQVTVLAPVSRPLLKLLQISQNTICSVTSS